MEYTIAYILFLLPIMLVLYLSSMEDLLYHRISKRYVIACFIIAIIYNNFFTVHTVEQTVTFVVALSIFGGITAISRGKFGIGDTLVLGALGWFIGNLIALEYFFMVLAFTALFVGAYYMIRQNRREKLKGWSRLFSTKQMIQTKDLRPGMILSDDNFMKGLTEKEIKDIHGTMGLDATICIKQAYPFIPVIFMSFLIFIAITLTGIVKI